MSELTVIEPLVSEPTAPIASASIASASIAPASIAPASIASASIAPAPLPPQPTAAKPIEADIAAWPQPALSQTIPALAQTRFPDPAPGTTPDPLLSPSTGSEPAGSEPTGSESAGAERAGAEPELPSPAPLTPAPLTPADVEAELGEIRILERPKTAPPPAQPTVQLLLRSGLFTSDNITALETFRRGDTVFYNSAVLLATPQLGPTTRLVATLGGNLLRYADRDASDYNQLTWTVGVQQRLSAGMYAQLGGGQDTLYQNSSGTRLLRDNALNFTLGRQDQLGQQVRLDSFYALRASFTNPDPQSQLSHSLGARLRYDFSPKFQGAIDYRLTFKDFTQVARFDTEHQIGTSLTYAITPKLFVAGTVSYLFGRSSNAAVDLNNFSVGISVGLNVPLF
jgi:Putative beta-barrel porin 2